MIFIDTGAFLARYVQRDQHHAQAIQQWEVLRQSGRRCFTSNFVLDETITLLARRAGYSFAAERARSLFQSNFLTILRPLGQDEASALVWFEKLADQKISFTDCVSFALMAGHGIKSAFAFDRHFASAGFQIEPQV